MFPWEMPQPLEVVNSKRHLEACITRKSHVVKQKGWTSVGQLLTVASVYCLRYLDGHGILTAKF